MNPDSNRFEALKGLIDKSQAQETGPEAVLGKLLRPDVLPCMLLRPDGSPVPKHWSIFTVGENVVIKNYTFKVAYIGETAILFEPVGPVVLNKETP